MSEGLVQLKAELTEAAAEALLATWHPRDDPAEQRRLVDAAYETAAEIVTAQFPAFAAALESSRLQGHTEGREEAADAVKADCSHGDMHYGNFNPETCPICTHFAQAARGVPVLPQAPNPKGES